MTNLKRQMPPKGSIFFGEVNDLSLHDKDRWQRREIIFHKADVIGNKTYNYPSNSLDDYIILIDTSSNRYKCEFSQKETTDIITLGTPSRLKPWYKKHFSCGYVHQIKRDGYRDRVFFEYTGNDFEFLVYTDNEFKVKYPNISV